VKILAIYRHYWPDATPYARLLQSILRQQVAEGHQAFVLTAQPSYNDIRTRPQPSKEVLDGVQVRRVPLFWERKSWFIVRLLNMGLFLLQAFAHVYWNRNRYDLIVANSHPPILMGWTLTVLKYWTGIPFLYHCQDIHPEALLLGNQLKGNLLAKCLREIDRRSCAAATCIVTLSNDMRDTLCTRNGGDDFKAKIAVLNNFPLERHRLCRESELPVCYQHNGARSRDRFRILFAGNIGEFQGLELIVDAARKIHSQFIGDPGPEGRLDPRSFEPAIEFFFMGAGRAVERLKSRGGEAVGKSIHFLPHVSVEVAFACIERSDLALVSLGPDIHRVAYPSKTMTCLEAGTPLLAVVDPKSQIAGEIRRDRLGYVTTQLSVDGIMQAVMRAFDERRRWDSRERQQLRVRATARFGKDTALTHWSWLFHALERRDGVWHEEMVWQTGERPQAQTNLTGGLESPPLAA
jgi:colanic acid biosynthesis glycosyl transferase WcaI